MMPHRTSRASHGSRQVLQLGQDPYLGGYAACRTSRTSSLRSRLLGWEGPSRSWVPACPWRLGPASWSCLGQTRPRCPSSLVLSYLDTPCLVAACAHEYLYLATFRILSDETLLASRTCRGNAGKYSAGCPPLTTPLMDLGIWRSSRRQRVNARRAGPVTGAGPSWRVSRRWRR
jgi:hypothetical protein